MKKLTRILAVVLTALAVLSLSACGNAEINKRLLDSTQIMVDAIITDDYRKARTVIADSVSDEDMQAIFPELCEYVEGVTEYKLMQTGWRAENKNGMSFYTAAFRMESNVGDFVINTVEIIGVEGLSSFDITRAEDSLSTPSGMIKAYTGSSPWQYVLLGVSALEIAFVVWMIVDCIRRRLRVKWAWILIMLIGMFTLSLTLGDAVAVNFRFGSLTYPTLLMIAGDTVRLWVLFPVGAVVYFFVRKQLTLPPEPEAVPYAPMGYAPYPQGSDSAEPPADQPQTNGAPMYVEIQRPPVKPEGDGDNDE